MVPAPMFDTQVAAMVCGYGDQVSYSELVQSVCKVTLDKSSRFTDWARRPLAQAQIDYAIGDVTHLRDIYRALLAQLEKSGRRVLARRRDEGADLGRDLRAASRARLGALQDAGAQAARSRGADGPRRLARERGADARRAARAGAEGRRADRSRARRAAHAARRSAICAPFRAAWSARGRATRSSPRSSAGWRATRRPCRKLERERRNGGGSAATVELLKVLLRQVSDESGVAGKMIATVDDLEAIAGDDRADVPALQGWRRKLFGERALELKRGDLALTVENGKVVALEWRERARRRRERRPAARLSSFVSGSRSLDARHFGDA